VSTPKSRFSPGNAAHLIKTRINPLAGDTQLPQLAKILAIEGMLSSMAVNLGNAYTSMFANRLGATATQIGLINALPQFGALLILLPGALLASRLHDQRRPVEIVLILVGLFYGLAGFSPYLGNLATWFLIGMISLANIPLVLYNTTWQNYFSDIVPAAQRNSHFTLRTSLIFLASIFTVQASGILLGSIQSDSVRILVYQFSYWLAFLVTIVQLRVMRQLPRDIQTRKGSGLADLRGALREIWQSRRFMIFIGVAVVFHFGFFMAWPLFFLLQVTYLHANEIWLSIISVPASILQWLTLKYWSRYIERNGNRKALVIGCLGMASNPALAVLAAYLPAGLGLPGLTLLNLVNACTFSAFQLALLQCLLEVVPQKFKPINLSLFTNALLLTNAIAPLVGVRLYNILGANRLAITLALLMAALLRLIGTGLFYIRWRHLRHEPDIGVLGH
jgi:hypothetical protein